jgi:hypothetical protein
MNPTLTGNSGKKRTTMEQPKTYSFSTFQELFDKVPSERMADCMLELCCVFIDAKRQAEILLEFAKHRHEADGTPFVPPCPLIELGLPLTWTDDGKDSPPVKIEIRGKDGTP